MRIYEDYSRIRNNSPIDDRPNDSTGVFLYLKDLPELLNAKGFNPSLQTVFYIHGYMESGILDLSVIAIRGAYLDREDHNVISISWQYYSELVMYEEEAIPQLMVVAETFAEHLRDLVYNGLNISTIHLVGHSLG